MFWAWGRFWICILRAGLILGPRDCWGSFRQLLCLSYLAYFLPTQGRCLNRGKGALSGVRQGPAERACVPRPLPVAPYSKINK